MLSISLHVVVETWYWYLYFFITATRQTSQRYYLIKIIVLSYIETVIYLELVVCAMSDKCSFSLYLSQMFKISQGDCEFIVVPQAL